MVRGFLILAATGAAITAVGAAPAPKPEAALKARHAALNRAIVRGDVKALKTYYLPDYYGESRGEKRNLGETLQVMEQVFQAGVKIQVKASLSQVSIKGDTASALETADVTVTAPNGQSQKLTNQKSRQSWKNVKGLWKLAWEKSVGK